MNENVKKGLIITIILILMAGIAFLIYWGVNNYEKVQEGLKGTGIYTAQDLENAKKEGYQEGANSLKDLEQQFENIKIQLDTKVNKVNELTQQVALLTKENDELKIENAQIESLNAQIALLNEQIKEYVSLLEAYSEYTNTTKIIKFYNDNEIFATKVVDNNTSYSDVILPEEPTKAGYVFKGWSLNNNEIFDFNSNEVITQNISFYAIYVEAYSIKFYTDYLCEDTSCEPIKILNVEKGTMFNIPNDIVVNSFNNFEFKGWVKLDTKELDLVNGYSVNSNTHEIVAEPILINDNCVFVAVYGPESGKYYVNGNSNIDVSSDGQSVTLPKYIEIPEFYGFNSNGNLIIENVKVYYQNDDSSAVQYPGEYTILSKNVQIQGSEEYDITFKIDYTEYIYTYCLNYVGNGRYEGILKRTESFLISFPNPPEETIFESCFIKVES